MHRIRSRVRAALLALGAAVGAALAGGCADPSSPASHAQPRAADLPVTVAVSRDSIWVADTGSVVVWLGVSSDQRVARGLVGARWTSSDTAVAVVGTVAVNDSTIRALVTSRGAGSATLTGTVMARDSSTATVTARVVVRPFFRLAVWPDTNALVPGLTRALAARDLTDAQHFNQASSVGWESDAPDVASVDTQGVVTAHAPGRATITAFRPVPGGGMQRAGAPVVVRAYPEPLAFTSLATDALAAFINEFRTPTRVASPAPGAPTAGARTVTAASARPLSATVARHRNSSTRPCRPRTARGFAVAPRRSRSTEATDLRSSAPSTGSRAASRPTARSTAGAR